MKCSTKYSSSPSSPHTTKLCRGHLLGSGNTPLWFGRLVKMSQEPPPTSTESACCLQATLKKPLGKILQWKNLEFKQLTSRCPMIWIPVAFCPHCLYHLSLFQQLYLLNSRSDTPAFAAAVTPPAHRLWRPYFCTSKPISWNFSFTISRTLVHDILHDFLIISPCFKKSNRYSSKYTHEPLQWISYT